MGARGDRSGSENEKGRRGVRLVPLGTVLRICFAAGIFAITVSGASHAAEGISSTATRNDHGSSASHLRAEFSLLEKRHAALTLGLRERASATLFPPCDTSTVPLRWITVSGPMIRHARW